jgi:hypothetical protein
VSNTPPVRPEAAPRVFTLTIEFNMKTLQTRVSGPLQNKHLCYGMLGCALEIIQKGADKGVERGSIVVPTLGFKPQ